jgi:two-component system alkaline phosphatase synthesis response regulator PhoP
MARADTRILIVDDQPGVRFFLKEVLEGEGYSVVAADSGEAALELIPEESFDAAIIDLVMKEVGGIEVLKALKQATPSAAAIVLTAHGSLETAVEALREGAHDYLFKPCRTSRLRKSVRTALTKSRREERRLEVLSNLEGFLTRSLEELREATDEPRTVTAERSQRSDAETSQTVEKGDLVVDFARHLIKINSHVVQLSPTEFDVLAYLISEAPRVVPTEELAREAQGYEDPWEASETVRYHIYRIRQKIEDCTGRRNVIHTVRGVGYTISDRER